MADIGKAWPLCWWGGVGVCAVSCSESVKAIDWEGRPLCAA